MKICMTGIDHSLAPVEVRERFSFTGTEKQNCMLEAQLSQDIEGCVLLSTCNRTELWVCCRNQADIDLAGLLCRFKDLDSAQFGSYFVSRSGEEAVSYLFEVTAGLQSRIIGEDQILAQVKKALDDAREAVCSCSVLDVLFRKAITGAKKVKTQLSLSTANASAVEYAIARLRERGMDFAGRKCLVIGNGEMGKRTASALIALGADVTVTIRQYRSGIVEVVPGCGRINYADRYARIPDCDIVVSATSSPNMTLTYDALSACGVRPGTVLIDLAVPRDIDPAAAGLPGVELMDIDSFCVPQTEELTTQLEQARDLIAEEQKKFTAWIECRDLLPKLDILGSKFSEAMLFRAGQSIKELNLTAEQRQQLEAALTEASDRVLKRLLFALRDEAGVSLFRDCMSVFSEVLGDD